jgi:hypothetical protein
VTDQTPLRDRIAEALMRWAEGNNSPKYAAMRRPETVVQNAYSRADAVLAVLPATTDQTAALTDREKAMLGFALEMAQEEIHARSLDFTDDDKAALDSLRRMADEAQPAETAAHRPLHQWRVEILDGEEWMPASRLHRDRSAAVDQLRMSSERRPLWNDGTPVQRRLVRETTTCTVEQPAAGARQDGAQS